MGQTFKHQNGDTFWHATTFADGLEQRCGGSGIVHCYCGGDACVCGNFGEDQCIGCADCETRDEDYDDDDPADG